MTDPVLLPQPRTLELGRARRPPAVPVVATDAALPAEGYRIRVGEAPDSPILIDAADPAGEAYARATLAQLEVACAGQLPACEIGDWPDLAVRGVMLDVSRDKVPTMDTLRALIDRLAGWKINQVQLYLEHTFAYREHEEVWAAASPFAPDEIVELDRYCAARHVELVPNQNCLGHFNRWLAHDRYRPLAVSPDGWERRGRPRPATTLDPSNPASLALVRSLLAELLPNFTSSRVHVGLDEPFELPAERLDDYLDYANRLRAIPELDGREVLMWGDMLSTPEAMAAIPEDMVVCEWGYDDWHPFDTRCADLAAAGRRFWVCPGTSAWLTLLGRWTNMVGDQVNAATAALAQGASGYLNTDWGDLGHLQQSPISEPGMAFGAAVSWCLEANRDLDLETALSLHAFADEAGELGPLMRLVGDTYLRLGPQFPNLSTAVLGLYYPQLQLGRGFTRGVGADEFAAIVADMDAADAALDRARPGRPDGALVVDELRQSTALVRLLAEDGQARVAGDGTLGSIPDGVRSGLADRLDVLTAGYRRLWLARNRPGGLDDSAAWLDNLGRAYRTGTCDLDWGGW